MTANHRGRATQPRSSSPQQPGGIAVVSNKTADEQFLLNCVMSQGGLLCTGVKVGVCCGPSL